jgi:repressor LexA
MYGMDVLPALTDRQRQVLDLVRQAIARHGLPPTRAEIAQALGFKAACSAEEHLRALERKGYLVIDGRHRGLRLSRAAEAHFGRDFGRSYGAAMPAGLPLVGRVAAGAPILAEQNIERHVELAADLFRPRADFLLRVRGLSMRDDGILDGDLVAVHRTVEASNGQTVVARLDDEATVKRFERRGRTVRLLPANPDFEPIVIDLAREPLAIEGRVVGVLRGVG